jgi:hypothetical protein
MVGIMVTETSACSPERVDRRSCSWFESSCVSTDPLRYYSLLLYCTAVQLPSFTRNGCTVIPKASALMWSGSARLGHRHWIAMAGVPDLGRTRFQVCAWLSRGLIQSSPQRVGTGRWRTGEGLIAGGGSLRHSDGADLGHFRGLTWTERRILFWTPCPT